MAWGITITFSVAGDPAKGLVHRTREGGRDVSLSWFPCRVLIVLDALCHFQRTQRAGTELWRAVEYLTGLVLSRKNDMSRRALRDVCLTEVARAARGDGRPTGRNRGFLRCRD